MTCNMLLDRAILNPKEKMKPCPMNFAMLLHSLMWFLAMVEKMVQLQHFLLPWVWFLLWVYIIFFIFFPHACLISATHSVKWVWSPEAAWMPTGSRNKNKRHLLFWWAEKLSRQYTTKTNPGRTGAHTIWAGINATAPELRWAKLVWIWGSH